MLCNVDKAASTYLLVAIVKEVGSVTQPGQEMPLRVQTLRNWFRPQVKAKSFEKLSAPILTNIDLREAVPDLVSRAGPL